MYIPDYFELEELMPKDSFKKYHPVYGASLWFIFDIRFLITLDRLRERFGKTFMNNWKTKKESQTADNYRGWRPFDCPIGAKLSQHKFGRAGDPYFQNATADEVREDLIKEKQGEKAKAQATEFLNALRGGKSISEESEKFGVFSTSSGLFKRNDTIPNIGFEADISKTAFKLSSTKDLPENPIKGQKGYYVIRFKERKEPEIAAFNEEKETVKEGLTQLKKRKAFDSWLATIRNNSEITIEKRFSDLQ